jgi:hypothetical protein
MQAGVLITEKYHLWARFYLGDKMQRLIILDDDLVWQDQYKSPRPALQIELESLEGMAKVFSADTFKQVAKRLGVYADGVVVLTVFGLPNPGEVVLNKVALHQERIA